MGETWEKLQKKSFYEATARERARGIADPETFAEFLGPKDRMISPHLPVLGEAVEFDDGIVTGVGKMGNHPVFVISQEGRFIGGAVGEVSGAKMAGMFLLALDAFERVKVMHGEQIYDYRPVVVISFETGGVRLHEANAGLLAHGEVMDCIQSCKGKVPVLALIGSKVGCFGGMGFVAASADMVIMSAKGRLGLTGPEVIEQEIGKDEFDASDKALIYRTTGGKHKYIMGDCNYLAEDTIGDFRDAVLGAVQMSYDEIAACNRIGSEARVEEQLALTELAFRISPSDSRDMWACYGNREILEQIPDMETSEFLQKVSRREREVK